MKTYISFLIHKILYILIKWKKQHSIFLNLTYQRKLNARRFTFAFFSILILMYQECHQLEREWHILDEYFMHVVD